MHRGAARLSPPDPIATECCPPPCPEDHRHADKVTAARTRIPAEETVDRLAGIFALLSNQTRLRIVMALRPDGRAKAPELCVCDLAELTSASESMASHQLRLLREGGLVTQRREGKLVRYRLVGGPIAHLLGDGLSYVAG